LKKIAVCCLALSMVFAMVSAMGLPVLPAHVDASAPGITLKAGDLINLGSYNHIKSDGTYETSKTPITWMVTKVDTTAGTVKLISKYVLDRSKMDTDTQVHPVNSTLAAWLNGYFLTNAFTNSEKTLIEDFNGSFPFGHNSNIESWDTTAPGVKVSFADYLNDSYYVALDKPLGMGGAFNFQNVTATYKSGGDASWWTGAAYGGGTGVTGIAEFVAVNPTTHVWEAWGNSLPSKVSGIRPMIVININDITLEGSGSLSGPYTIVTEGASLKEWDEIALGRFAHATSGSGASTVYESSPSDIQWIVVDTDAANHTARLVSKYVLANKQVDTIKKPIIYSPLADWLTGDNAGNFKHDAFTLAEQSLLLNYDRTFYSVGPNGEKAKYGMAVKAGTKVSFVDYVYDSLYVAPTHPLGIQNDSTLGNIKATYKSGTPSSWWSGMSPGGNTGEDPVVSVDLFKYISGSNWGVWAADPTDWNGVRPIIKIDTSQITMIGSGTATDPYRIAGLQMPKTKSAMYPASLAAAMQANNSPDAVATKNQIIADAAYYKNMTDEDLWSMMFPPNIGPRELMVSADGHCPITGEPATIYSWVIDPITDPWKVKCPQSGLLFPSNDFESYYKSGIDPTTGLFNKNLANPSYLVNELYPNMPSNFGVDDGTGYRGTDPVTGQPYTWYFVGAYVYEGQWLQYVLDAISRLSSAYMVTGDTVYARKTAIVLDRVADLYPNFDYKTQGLVYGQPTSEGYVTYSITSALDVRLMAESYDMIYDGIKNDQQLVNFLHAKSVQYPDGIARKNNFGDIKRNIEYRIFLDVLSKPQKIYSNYPTTDITIATIKNVLEWPGAKDELKSIVANIVNENTKTDGLSGNEKGLTDYAAYNVWSLAPLISKFTALDSTLLPYLVQNCPNLTKAYEFYLDLWYNKQYYPHQGDGGWYAATNPTYLGLATSKYTMSPSSFMYLWNLYEATGNTLYAKLMYITNGNSVSGLPFDLTYSDPAGLQAEVQSIVNTEGANLQRGNVNKEQWGIAMLRSNEQNAGPALWLNYQSIGILHGNADGLHMGLYAKGLDLMPDQGYPDVGYPGGWDSPQAQWNKRIYSHNLVVVDKEDFGALNAGWGQNLSLGTTTLWANGSSFSAIRVDEKDAYTKTANGRYERTLALVGINSTDAYALDIFRVAGGKEHSRMMSSLPGTMTTSGLNLASQDFFKNLPVLAPIVSNEKVATAPQQGFSVDWKVTDINNIYNDNRDVHLKYTDLTSNVTEAHTFDAWISYGDFNNKQSATTSRLATVRRSATAPLQSTFVGVIEPYQDSPNISSITRLQVTDGNGTAMPDGYAAVQVELANGDKDLIIAADPQLYQAGGVLKAAGWNVQATAELTMVRVSSTGTVKRVVVSKGSGVVVNGQTYSVVSGDFLEQNF